jgi:hypothetical protein
MNWRGLGHHVNLLRDAALALPSHASDPREAAAELAMRVHGRTVMGAPAMVNVAGLAMATLERLTVHEVRLPVPDTVAATDLHSLPDQPPRLLRRPCIVEVRTPGPELLFGDTASLGCYELDGARYLVGLQYPDGALVAQWKPRWSGGELDQGVTREPAEQPLLEGIAVDEHHAWACDAARFLVVLGLLLDAEATPLTTTEDAPATDRRKRRKKKGTASAKPWAVTRVYLQSRPKGSGGAAGDGSGVDGKTAAQVEVRGHLKRQPHGPGGSLRKWVYVAAYEARRWVAPGGRVVVDG